MFSWLLALNVSYFDNNIINILKFRRNQDVNPVFWQYFFGTPSIHHNKWHHTAYWLSFSFILNPIKNLIKLGIYLPLALFNLVVFNLYKLLNSPMAAIFIGVIGPLIIINATIWVTLNPLAAIALIWHNQNKLKWYLCALITAYIIYSTLINIFIPLAAFISTMTMAPWLTLFIIGLHIITDLLKTRASIALQLENYTPGQLSQAQEFAQFANYNPNTTKCAISNTDLLGFTENMQQPVIKWKQAYCLAANLPQKIRDSYQDDIQLVPAQLTIKYSEEITCPITLCPIDAANNVRSIYGHYFNKDTIAKWLQSTDAQDKCPMTKKFLIMQHLKSIDCSSTNQLTQEQRQILHKHKNQDEPLRFYHQLFSQKKPPKNSQEEQPIINFSFI